MDKPESADTQPERLQLLQRIEQAVDSASRDTESDPFQPLGRAVAQHLPLLRDMLSTGTHGEPIVFEDVRTPGEAVRFALRLSHLRADAWRVDWIASATGEPDHEFHASLLDALLSAEGLGKAHPPMASTLTPLFADRACALTANLLRAAREVAGLAPPQDDDPLAALARLREAAQAFSPLSLINPYA